MFEYVAGYALGSYLTRRSFGSLALSNRGLYRAGLGYGAYGLGFGGYGLGFGTGSFGFAAARSAVMSCPSLIYPDINSPSAFTSVIPGVNYLMNAPYSRGFGYWC